MLGGHVDSVLAVGWVSGAHGWAREGLHDPARVGTSLPVRGGVFQSALLTGARAAARACWHLQSHSLALSLPRSALPRGEGAACRPPS